MLCWFLPYINMNQHKYTHAPPTLEPPCHLPPHPTTQGCHRAPRLSSLHHTANSHWLPILQCICFHATLSIRPTLYFPSPYIHSLFSMSMSRLKLKVLVTPSCPILCNPMDCSPRGSSVHGIFQARILEWVAIPFSRGSSLPRDRTQVSHNVGRFFTI